MALTGEDILALMKKHPVGFGCGAVAVACGVLFYFRSGKIVENQKLYEQKSAEAAKILTNVTNSANLPEQAAALQAASKEIESRLVRAGALAINLQYFYKLEAETEVKLLEVRQGGIPTPDKGAAKAYVGVPYTVALQGSFKQVMNFIQRLENGPHFCRFNSIGFSKIATGGENPLVGAMSLNLTIELLGQP